MAEHLLRLDVDNAVGAVAAPEKEVRNVMAGPSTAPNKPEWLGGDGHDAGVEVGQE